MNKVRKSPQELSAEERERLLEAEKSYEKMEEEIAPYVKRRRTKKYSTAGKWGDASDYERTDFFRDLRKVIRKLPPDHPSRSDSRKR
jgi:ABC-type transporter MlaC component